MKNIAILFAALLLSFQVAQADNVKPASAAKVSLEHNGFNFVNVSIDKSDEESARIKFYSSDFTLLHSELVRKEDLKRFDISRLDPGTYIVKVEVAGETVYTTTIRKVK